MSSTELVRPVDRNQLQSGDLLSAVSSLFRKPSARQVAKLNLEEAERLLLAYQDHMEHCKYMVLRYQDTVARLRRYMREEPRGDQT